MNLEEIEQALKKPYIRFTFFTRLNRPVKDWYLWQIKATPTEGVYQVVTVLSLETGLLTVWPDAWAISAKGVHRQ